MCKLYLIKAGAVFLLLLLLASCDPQTCGTAHIVNSASDTIYVTETNGTTDTLAPGGAKAGNQVCGLGMGTEPGPFLSGLDQVRRDTATCKKDIRDTKNWVTTKSSKYNFEHYFTVTDADF